MTTIPAQLLQAGKSLKSGATIPSGMPPTVENLLSATDVIVRGTLGESRSYLSDDQTEVYTDYDIQNPQILYRAHPGVLSESEPSRITVTLWGGTVTINGLSFEPSTIS